MCYEDIYIGLETALVSGYEWFDDDEDFFMNLFYILGFGEFTTQELCYLTSEGWIPVKSEKVKNEIKRLENEYEDDALDFLEDAGFEYCFKAKLSLKSRIIRWLRLKTERSAYKKALKEVGEELMMQELRIVEDRCLGELQDCIEAEIGIRG